MVLASSEAIESLNEVVQEALEAAILKEAKDAEVSCHPPVRISFVDRFLPLRGMALSDK